MQIKEILANFNEQLNDFFNEKRKNKPITFQVDWRNEQFDIPIIDMQESYWYLEDDGTIVFRINDDIGVYDEYRLKIGTLNEFKVELEEFLKRNGNEEQETNEDEIKNNFFFYTSDDGFSGSYWLVNDFTFIDDGDKVIIKINDWG